MHRHEREFSSRKLFQRIFSYSGEVEEGGSIFWLRKKMSKYDQSAGGSGYKGSGVAAGNGGAGGRDKVKSLDF